MPYYNRKSGGGILDTTHLYMSLSVANHYSGTGVDTSGALVQSATSNKEVAINFEQYRGAPYLETPNESFLSVQRFTIYSPNLPVFIAQPVVGATDVNDTIYVITIKRDTNTYQFNVKWQPQNLNVPAPSSPVKKDDIYNPYYYCYSYEWFIKCINDSISANIPALIGPTIYNNPFMVYDTLTNLFSVVGSVNSFRTDNLGNSLATSHPSKFYMNVNLYNLFASIPSIYVANTIILADYQIVFSTGTNQPTSGGQAYIINTKTIGVGLKAYNAIYSTQEYGSLPLWSPIKSIVFRVSILTVVSENIATPVIYENGNRNINDGKPNTDILPTMIEYSVPLETGTEYKPYIFFEPRGEFRLTDLNNDCSVQGLQFNVFWKDTFGRLIPFYLDLGSCLTLKLLFRKKSFNSDQL